MSTTQAGRLGRAWERANAQSFLELLALTGIAVAQPVFDVLNNSPETLIGHQASGVAIVLATVVVVLAPPLALWGLETVVGALNRRAGAWLHTGLLGFLAGVVAVEVAKRATPLRPSRLIAGGVVVALVAAALTRLSLVRLWLRYLAIAPLAFAVLFLSTSPVRALLVENAGRSPDVGVRRPAPVVVMVLDEFPLMSLLDGRGQIDRSLYPNFAALADGANWYRNNTTVSPLTASAVPAILTGRYPTRFGIAPTLTNLPENLFTLLGNTYEMHASEIFTSLCPRNLCQGSGRSIGAVGPLLGDAVDVFNRLASPSRSTAPVQFSGDLRGEPDAPARVRAFIRSLRRSERPRLDFIHLMLPHGAWRYLTSGQRYEAPNPPTGFVFNAWGDDSVALAARQRHLLQVQYTDAVIGEVMARMKALRTYDESLFIVTADHGAAFTAKTSYRAISAANYEQILWTPLFVKLPGQTRGEVSDRQVRSIDVLPTIADVLGVKLPWKVDGTSVLRSRRERDNIRVLSWPGRDQLKARADGYLRLDARAGFAHVLQSAVPKGGGGADLALYQVGRFGSLVGEQVDRLPSAPAVAFTARLDEPDRWTDVDPGTAEVPVYVSGKVRTREPVAVVVSVNGIVGGWSETFKELARAGFFGERNRRGFFTMIPPHLLRAGRNQIEVFVARGDAGSASLSPVPFITDR
jgi:hypothetical protein